MFTRADLNALISAEGEPAVSIYLPTHTAGRETRQDPIRLRNLLSEAGERLHARGARSPEIESVLGRARELLAEEAFWRHQDRGLALFMAPGHFQCHRLPAAFDEAVVIGRRFHVKPLLPLLGADGTYYVVTITAEAARLFEGSRHGLAAVEVPDIPGGTGAIARETDYQEMVHAGPVARPRSGSAAEGTIPKSHGFGDSPEELRKLQLIEYLRRADRTLEQRLGGDQAPVVLVALPEIEGNFRAVTQLKTLLPEALATDPGTMQEPELHERSYALVRPLFEARRLAAREELDRLLGNGDARGSVRPEEIVKAARWGRVDTLFLAAGERLWGRFDESADRVEIRGAPGEQDEDLLDYAAVQTLLQGGTVHFLAERLPRGGAIAAVLRY